MRWAVCAHQGTGQVRHVAHTLQALHVALGRVGSMLAVERADPPSVQRRLNHVGGRPLVHAWNLFLEPTFVQLGPPRKRACRRSGVVDEDWGRVGSGGG